MIVWWWLGCGRTPWVPDDAQVVCWGNNKLGQLGTPGPEEGRPVVLEGTSVVAGHAEVCVRSDGPWRCQGGDAGPAGATAATVTARTFGSRYQCVLDGGVVSCWGDNLLGQLGRAYEPPPSDAVVELELDALLAMKLPDGIPGTHLGLAPVDGLTDATAIAGGSSHTCAVRAGGTVVCWGGNEVGQLTGDSEFSAAPIAVPGLAGVTKIAAGGRYTCAVTAGAAWCWGSLAEVDYSAPQIGTPPTRIEGLTDVVDVAVGDSEACARTARDVSCWTHGQAPRTLVLPGPAADLALGWRHGCAALVDGTVWCWGENDFLQLGREAGSPAEPAPIPRFGGVSRVVARGGHTCALRAR